MTDCRRQHSAASSLDYGVDKSVAPAARARRRSDYGHANSSGARAESWVAKVTSAMSQRLFSSSKKLSGSRSTQVMPMAAADTVKPAASRLSASLASPASPVQAFGESHTRHDATQHKVAPGDAYADEEAPDAGFQSVYAAPARLQSREAADDASVDDAGPVLRGFFARDACAGQQRRAREGERRRDALYEASRRRQHALRVQAEQQHEAAEHARRRRKAEQLRRLGQQRRLELRRSAAQARGTLVRSLQRDEQQFASERARWEAAAEDELRVLSAAFRKAQTASSRPVTVAGLAVPEAIAQLERDAVVAQRRVRTALEPSRRRLSGAHDALASPWLDACEALALEDSEEVFELFHGHESVAVEAEKAQQSDVHALLDEKEGLLQRLAAIEHLVQAQQQ